MEKVKLGELTTIKTGKLDVNAENPKGQYPFFTCSKNHTYIDNYAFEGESILVAGNGDLNVKYYNGKFNAYQRTYVIQSNERLHAKYLYFFLDKYVEKLREQSIGGVIKYIKLGNLTDAKIPLPPLHIQKAIAAKLDKAQEIIAYNQQLLEKYDQLTQSLFIDMFGDPVKNEKGWEKDKVINYCSCIVPGRDKPKSFTGNIPWITTEDLIHLGITISSKKNIGLNREEILNVNAKKIPIGSVIITCVGNLGIVSINQKEIIINQQLHSFQCFDCLNNIFLMYVLSYQKLYMYKMASSTTVPYMNKSICNSIPIIVPPIHLQNQFAERVAQIEIQKTMAQESLAKSQQLFQSLLKESFK